MQPIPGPMSSKPSTPMATSSRLLLTVGLCFGGGAMALGGWEFADAQDRVVEASRARAEAAGVELRARIDAPYLEVLATILPDRESVWTWDGQGTDLHELHEAIAATAERHGFERVRTLRPKDDQRDALRKASREPHRAALESLVSNAPTPDWRKPADYVPEMRESLRHGKVAATFRDSRRHGPHVDTWVPLLDRTGDPILLLELSENVTDPLHAAHLRALFVAALGLALAAFTTVLATRQGGAADRALAGASRALRQFTRLDLDKPIRAHGEATLVAAEAARVALSNRLAEVQGRLNLAEARLRTAEAMMDSRTTERREALARVATGPLLMVDAGGSRRELAHLVDLSFAHLVARVERYTMVDLAPGMSVDVAWIDQEEAPYELVVSRRIETDEGVEYVFALPNLGELPGTPPEIACIAFARGSERASAEFTEVSGTLLAGLGGPLVATVLDLSADGAGILVPVTPHALASTGTRTTFLLQLALDEEPLSFGVIVRSVRATADGCFVGLQFDAEVTGDFDARRARVAGWVTERLRALALVAAGVEMEYAA
jgi:hypothetical protein